MIYAIVKKKFQAIKNSPYIYYLFASFLILTATLGKIGSSSVYFLEFIVACLLWIVFFTKSFPLNFSSSLKRMSPLVVLYVIVLFELTHAERLSYSFTDQGITAYREAVYKLAREEIDELQPAHNRFLTLNSQIALYSLQSNVYLNDPFNYWLMWDNGILDIDPLLRAINERFFSIILSVDFENPYHVSSLHFNPSSSAFKRMVDVLKENYVLTRKGVFLYFIPREYNPNHG
jgi:hypothetical protein